MQLASHGQGPWSVTSIANYWGPRYHPAEGDAMHHHDADVLPIARQEGKQRGCFARLSASLVDVSTDVLQC